MTPLSKLVALATLIAGTAAACNPTIDPDATFTARGEVVDAAGAPLAGAEVRLIKYSSDLNIFAPSIATLFADNPRGDDDIGLHVAVVQTVRTDMSGKFDMSFLGRDIKAANAFMGSDGRVEVATAVIVVRDPSDPRKQAGVFSYEHRYQDSDRIWEQPARMNLWRAEAKAETEDAATTGLVKLSWNKLERPRMSGVRNLYRVDIFGDNSGRLILRCNEGSDMEGGCARSADPSRLERFVSAWSIHSYYSDGNGMFSAYVQASGADFRYVSAFEVTQPIPDIRNDRERVAIEGLWAAGMGADQSLLEGAATDNNPETTVRITNNARAIYAKLPLTTITDAGLLNALVDNAANGCLSFEFSVQVFDGIAAAKDSPASVWTKLGKFCGEIGGKGEVSALLGFDTQTNQGVAAAWMRVVAEPDAGSAALFFRQIGEVTVLQRRSM